MSLKRRGFTLVELLAVIVILAIVLAIAVPSITGIIKRVTKNAFEQDAKMVIKAIDYQVLQDPGLDINVISASNIESKLDISNNNYDSLSVVLDENNKHYIYIEGKNKWADLVACGTYNNITVEPKDNIVVCAGISNNTSTTGYQDETGAFPPELEPNMIPIKWKGEVLKWVKADLNKEWYDYENKEWANAVLVKSEELNKYKTAKAGSKVLEADVLAYLVWIPRYHYKIFNADFEPYYNTPTATIELNFETSTTNKKEGEYTGEWLTHPAFTFGDDELTGFWIGKYETGGEEEAPLIKPGIISKSGLNVSEFFAMNKLFNTEYGLDSNFDGHLIRNMEWGAVGFLTYSVYGKNEDVWANNCSSHITGCGSNSRIESFNKLCQNEWHTPTGMLASTTGNMYGVYDMSGGVEEYVMGAMYKDLAKSGIDIQGAGFNETDINSVAMEKYLDKYTWGDSHNDDIAYSRSQLGDALAETRKWHYGYDFISFVYSVNYYQSYSWFTRGNSYSGNYSGIFEANYSNGEGSSLIGSRLAITPLNS